jgi:hypothetical protein
VSFSNDHTIIHDSGSPTYTAPHWKKGRTPSEYYPIGYTGGKEIKMEVKYKCNPDIALTPGVELKARGKSSMVGGKYPTGEGTAAISGSTITANLTCGNTDSLKVDYLNLFLEWQLKSPNAQFDWKTTGYSTNRLYVTYKEPLTSLRQETLYDLACKTNAGVTNQTQIAMNSYNRFTGRNVKRLGDDKVMTYWKDDVQGARETATLLASPDGNGNCESWSALFRDVLKLNGLGAERVSVFSNTAQEGVLVKNWHFDGTPKGSVTTILTGPNGIANTYAGTEEIQSIPVGNGLPDIVCIYANAKNLVTIPLGDDIVSPTNPNIILAGINGICDTNASGNDIQNVGNGDPVSTPNEICIEGGFNLSTSVLVGDDNKIESFRFPDGTKRGIILNGTDGIVNTSAVIGDTQMIPVGQGLPDTVCICPMPSKVIMSTPLGDDSTGNVTLGTASEPYPYTTWHNIWARNSMVDAYPLVGIPGQGNSDPPPSFNGHWITYWNDGTNHYYFDPSYGSSIVSANDNNDAIISYENSAFAGFSGTMRTSELTGVRKNDLSTTTSDVYTHPAP